MSEVMWEPLAWWEQSKVNERDRFHVEVKDGKVSFTYEYDHIREMGGEFYDTTDKVTVRLADDIRLCRAVSAEPWSRVTPTEEDRYWYVGNLAILMDGGGVLDQIYLHSPDLVRIRGESVLYNGYAWSLPHCTGWWRLARVPQPPGGGRRWSSIC